MNNTPIQYEAALAAIETVIVPLAFKGSVGKSKFLNHLTSLYAREGVEWGGADCDFDNQSSFQLYPKRFSRPVQVEGDHESITRTIVAAVKMNPHILVIDPQAHKSDTLLAVLNDLGLLSRSTFLYFPIDQAEVLMHIRTVHEQFSKKIRTALVVRNHYHSTKLYEGSKLDRLLSTAGVEEFNMPKLAISVTEWVTRENLKREERLTYRQWAAHSSIPDDLKVLLQAFLADFDSEVAVHAGAFGLPEFTSKARVPMVVEDWRNPKLRQDLI